MPKGLKGTSSTVAIGFRVLETAPNTFIELEVDLNLDPLNREVFVVQAVDLTLGAADAIAATDTAMACSVTTTRQTAVQTLQNSDYVAIIATNDFFVQVAGTNNAAAHGVSGKLYGYRAQASADIYAALVQSEVLSA